MGESRRSLVVSLVLSIFALSLAMPSGTADPRVELGYTALVGGGFSDSGDGACSGTLTITTDKPVLPTETAAVVVTLAACAIESIQVITTPVVIMSDPQGGGGKSPDYEGHVNDPCEKTGCPDAPEKPGAGSSTGHGSWETKFCETETACWAEGTLSLEVYQAYHTSDSDNPRSDGSGGQCVSGGVYTTQSCEMFQGSTYGSQLSAQTKGTSTFRGWYLTGYATMYTYFDGRHQTQCSFSGDYQSWNGGTSQVVCD